MLSIYTLSQVIGFVGLIFVVYAFQKEKKVEILKVQTVGSLLFSTHFLLLEAYIGALLSGTVVIRNNVFMRKHSHKWANKFYWPYIFSGLSIVWLMSAWEGWISLLPVAGMIIATFAMWIDDSTYLKKLIIISAMMWIPYSIYHQAIPSLINQILVCLSALISNIREQRKLVASE